MKKKFKEKAEFFVTKFFVLLLISLLVAFILTGCEGLIPGSSFLTGTQWKLTAWSESSLDPAQFTITVHFDESTLFGTAAVNAYSGSYMAMTNYHFSVGDLQMTLIAGSEEAMHVESAYFQLLQEACQYTVNQNTLTLFDALENELLVFSRMTPK